VAGAEALVFLLLAVALLASVGLRWNVPYPVVLVVGGLALGLVPGLPVPELDPDIVFFAFLPPLLYAAAFQASAYELRANAAPIGLLAVGLVLVTVVAVAGEEIVGELRVEPSWFGYGEIGMMVAAGWRGRGVGSALVAAAIEWGRAQGMHKLSLSVFPHNAAAIALYRKFGFVEEGRRIKHLRRANGELWDLIDMGLLL